MNAANFLLMSLIKLRLLIKKNAVNEKNLKFLPSKWLPEMRYF